jgi:hypothetical protein
MEQLLRDAGRRSEQIESFGEIAVKLGRGGPPPSERAAEVVLRLAEAEPERGH